MGPASIAAPSPRIRLTILQTAEGDRRVALEARSRVNRWVASARPSRLRDWLARPEVFGSWRELVERVEKEPHGRILVLLAPSPGEVHGVAQALANYPLDTVLWRPGTPDPPLLRCGLADGAVVVGGELETALRKRVLSQSLRPWLPVRPLRTPAELQAYFRLRYEVWKEMGYLAPERDVAEVGWELDPSDRRALPFGAFAPDGALVGCVRLVLSRVLRSAQARIAALLDEVGNPRLKARFAPPQVPQQPYDVLDSFPAFRQHYAEWQRRGVSRAEVSRVIVHSGHRRRGLAEALVDAALGAAQREGVEIAFLACVAAHEPLYRSCGFEPIPDMTCASFVEVRVPAIGMWRRLGGRNG